MNTNTLTGKAYIAVEWFARLALLNILWVIFNIPFLMAVINVFMSRTKTELIIAVILLAIFIPLVLFPATMALFVTVRSLVIQQSPLKLIRGFWRGFKEGYGRSFLGGIVFGTLWIILIVDLIYFNQYVHALFKYVFYALFLFTLMCTLHFFSSNVHFETRFVESIKNAFLFTLKNPIVSLGSSIASVIIIFISYKFPFLLLLFVGSTIATLAFIVFYKISLKGLLPVEEGVDM